MKRWQINRSLEILRNDGFFAWISAVRQYWKDQKKLTPVVFNGLPMSHWEYITNFQKFEKKPHLPKPQKGNSFTVNWIIPAFGKGSGGQRGPHFCRPLCTARKHHIVNA